MTPKRKAATGLIFTRNNRQFGCSLCADDAELATDRAKQQVNLSFYRLIVMHKIYK